MSIPPATDPLLPTFIVIGAAKCGTTTLAASLARHPDVFVTDPKEPHVFDPLTRHAGDLDWYRSLFEPGRDKLARGEASTGYTKRPYLDIPKRIHDVVPRARLVYLIRDPFDRIESYYLMMLRQGTTEGDLAEVVRRNREYVDTSSYGLQLSTYLEYFSRDQILVCRLEDLAADATSVVRQVLSFIGVDPDRGPDSYDERLNARPEGPARRPVRTPALLRPILTRAPRGLKSSLKDRLRREVASGELMTPNALRAELRDTFVRDFATLRQIVGPDMDLYGLA